MTRDEELSPCCGAPIVLASQLRAGRMELYPACSRCGASAAASAARPALVDALAREVADLRCTLREIRDLTTEPAVRDLAASRLVQ